MERDGFPERYHVLPTPKDVGGFLVRALDKLPTMLPKTPLGPGDHVHTEPVELEDDVIVSLRDGAYPPEVCDGFEAAYRQTRG